MTEADELRRIAIHEAGHAAMCRFLGRRVSLVTVEPTAQFGGSCFHGVARFPASELKEVGRPVVLLPGRMRRAVEGEALVALAGPISERFYAARGGYMARSPDELAAESITRAGSGLSPYESELFDRYRREADPIEDDESRAVRMAWLLSGATASAHLGLLRAVTAEIVGSARFARLVHSLADELLIRRTLGGGRVRAIFRQVEGGSQA